jgi:cob(I)alamin adenosyltransferase
VTFLSEPPERAFSHYARQGDRGETGRLGGDTRVTKNSVLIEAVGAVDEATAAIGLARASSSSQSLKDVLLVVQKHLSRMLAHLSATPEAREQYPGLSPDEVAWLEGPIAEIEADLPPIREFVMPGTTLTGAAFHVARTVVRRAERRVVALAEIEPGVQQPNLSYLNRLSSLLFVAAVA